MLLYAQRGAVPVSAFHTSSIRAPRDLGRSVEEEEDGRGDVVVVPDELEVCGQARDLCVANIRAIPTRGRRSGRGLRKREEGAYRKERR